MYAVIETGGKQYRVELGSEIQVDRLDARPGDSITLERVLLVADGDATAVGQPIVDGAQVRAEVVAQDRGDKVVVFKYKQKVRTRKKAGFRAELTRLRVADIAYGDRSAAADALASEGQKSKTVRAAEKAAAEKAAADQELAARLAAVNPTADASAEAEAPTSSTKTSRAPAAKADDAAHQAEAAPAQADGALTDDAAAATVAPTDDAPAATDADPDTQKDE